MKYLIALLLLTTSCTATRVYRPDGSLEIETILAGKASVTRCDEHCPVLAKAGPSVKECRCTTVKGASISEAFGNMVGGIAGGVLALFGAGATAP